MAVIRSALELLGVVLFRFHPFARVWVILLMLVNLLSILFLATTHGKIAFASMCLGVVVMIAICGKLKFVRLLGIGHIFGIPMLAWFLIDFPQDGPRTGFTTWLTSLIVCNSISLILDTMDVVRFLRGDRKPYYS